MGIKVNGVDELMKHLDICYRIIYNEIITTLAYLGEQCVSKIRDRSGEESWFDQTGNLRSSIGYAVYERGKKTIEAVFNQVLDGSEGTEAGRIMVNDLAQKYSSTYALVVVAGMNYADKVETLDNKDVLASTELWARGVIQNYLNTAKIKALNKINSL